MAHILEAFVGWLALMGMVAIAPMVLLAAMHVVRSLALAAQRIRTASAEKAEPSPQPE